MLLPVGPGEPRTLNIQGIQKIENGTSHFLSDGKHITLNAHEPGQAVRCYEVDVDTGNLSPLTPEGVTCSSVSPDRRLLFGRDGTTYRIYPTSSVGTPKPIFSLDPGVTALQWSEDGSSIYAYREAELPAKIYKINLKTGARTPIQELQPGTTAGLVTIRPVVVTRDGSRFAYSYYQVLSALYEISGLK
jgi:hypothetical protein